MTVIVVNDGSGSPKLTDKATRGRRSRSTLRRVVRSKRGAMGLGIAGVVILIAVVGPFVTPDSPIAFVSTPFAAPSASNLLGGDQLGRDVLSRVLDGGWVLLVMAAAATAFGVIVGATAGISAAYLGRRVDGLIMRTVDVILAFPSLVFALLLVSIIGPKIWLIILAVGFAQAPPVARVMRSATLDVSERDFVKVAELQGMKPSKVMRSELLPNLVSPLMVESGLRLTFSIVVISGLAFLGFGLAPPAANWGYMIRENIIGLQSNPWGVIVPASLIALLTVGTNTFTDAVARVVVGVEGRSSDAILTNVVGSEVLT